LVKIITSPSNPLVKHISLLSEKSKLRKETGTFVVEGKKEIMLALKGGYQLKSLLFNPAIITFNKLNALLGNVILETECIDSNSQNTKALLLLCTQEKIGWISWNYQYPIHW